MLVSGRHFFANVEPEALGHKALAVNLSDMAAMGATPRWALLAGALPDADPQWLKGFARGFFALAAVHGVDLVGGDTTRGPLNLCVTLLGEVPAGKALLRSGALAGDSIWLSGALGDASLALAHHAGRVVLSADEAAACWNALLRPAPRVALGIQLRGLASAAIDVSDGLVGDLGHVLEASKVGAVLELAAIPRSKALDRQLASSARDIALQCLLAGGDDYELCFTAAPSHDPRVVALATQLGLGLRRVGTITAEPRVGRYGFVGASTCASATCLRSLRDMKKTPTLAFLFGHPAHFLALGFGAGLSPVAPGTVGTLVALPLAALLHATTDDAGI